MTPTKAQLEQAIADDLSHDEAAARFGCGRSTIHRRCRAFGLRWGHRGRKKPTRYVEIDDEWMTLKEASLRYDIPFWTINKRYTNGDRGRDLIRPVRLVTPKPDCYETGIRGDEWPLVVEYARKRSPRAAASKFGLKLGAVNAALRGEEHRLG